MNKYTLLIAGLTAMCTPFAATAQEKGSTQAEMIDHVNYTDWARGTYEYITGKTGKVRGQDEFNLTVNKDGSRTMRMLSIIPDTKIMRDVVHRVDANFRPVETFVSVFNDGVRTGAGMFVFDGSKGKGLVLSNSGILTQEVDIPGHFSMIPHSMPADGWYFNQYDHAKGGLQDLKIFNPSGGGESVGSVLARVQTVQIRYVGKERITVPAGTFEAEHWELPAPDADNQIWVYGPDRIMVRFIDVGRDRVYNLKTFKTSRKK